MTFFRRVILFISVFFLIVYMGAVAWYAGYDGRWECWLYLGFVVVMGLFPAGWALGEAIFGEI